MPYERPSVESTARPVGGRALVDRFFGGRPLSVIFRLVLLSILIGVILEVMGLDPLNIIDSLRRLLLRVWDMGFDAVRWLWRYLVLGASIVLAHRSLCAHGERTVRPRRTFVGAMHCAAAAYAAHAKTGEAMPRLYESELTTRL